MQVLITEFMDTPAVERLRASHDVLYDPMLIDDLPRLLSLAPACDAIIVRNRTQVRGDLLGSLSRCRVVGRLGVGLDNIDLDTCRRRGIQVIPATGANAHSVAEYVIATAMLLLRGAYGCTEAVAAGEWPRAALSNGRELAGTTLGLVGYGGIGQLTAKLGAALGMRLCAYDPAIPSDSPVYRQSGAEPLSLDALLQRADVVSLHVPLLDSTRSLFDAGRIASMKRGAILINTARGGIVDDLAVAQALHSGHLGGAALDVFTTEPMPANPQLAGCPNLLLTPHVAGLTVESNERVSSLVAEGVLKALR